MHESMVNYTHSTTGVTIRHNFRETNVTLNMKHQEYTYLLFQFVIPLSRMFSGR